MDFFECPFSLHARKDPDATALIWGKEKWSYKECHERICGIANALKKIGVKKGDLIAVSPAPLLPVPLLFFALFRLQAIVYPLRPDLPVETASRYLKTLKSSLFLFPDQTPFPIETIPSLSFSALFRQATLKTPPSSSFLVKKRAATYLTTSGTTAEPKVASLSCGNHYYSALGSNGTLPSLQKGDRWLLSLPLYHVAGIAILFRSFLAKATVVLPQKNTPLNATAIQGAGITHLSLVPTQLSRLLEGNQRDWDPMTLQLKSVLLGGAPISSDLYMRGIQNGLKLYPSYGMTEMSSQITTNITQGSPFFSLGSTLPYRELKIAPDGEIWVKGKTLFQGYVTSEKKYERASDQEGFFPTRDLGRYSNVSGLTLLGRKDRLFISGGENIHPEEIERALLGIQGVLEARVTPVKDEEFGFRPIAHIHSKIPFQAKELTEKLSSKLPKWKIPIEFLPMNLSQ